MATFAEIIERQYSPIVFKHLIARKIAQLEFMGESKAKTLLENIHRARLTEVGTLDERVELLATGKKTTVVAIWPNVIYSLTRAEDYLKKHKIVGKRCYLGQELAAPMFSFMVLFSQKSPKLSRAMLTIMESGIYSMWDRELSGFSVSSTVQRRSKVVSPIKILQEPDIPEALKLLEGKLSSAFILWLGSILLCGEAFLAELVSTKYKLSYSKFQQNVKSAKSRQLNC